jgi:hypothetical protein
MSNLRKRIETLSSTTSSLKAIELCNEALSKISEYTEKYTLTPTVFQQVEYTVGSALAEGLELATDKDAIVENFIATEKRIVGVNNLGVKEAIAAVKTTDLYNHPSLRYVAENLSRFENQPEYLTVYAVVEQLKYFSFDPTISEHVNKITENVTKYSEDIKIYTAVKAIKETASSFLYSSFSTLLENYLNKRTEATRSSLLEGLNKFTYDPNVKSLFNVVSESSTKFTIKSTVDSAIIENIYSPVYINETTEYFNVRGKYFSKTGETLAELTESEVNDLPADFKFVSEFINRSNVRVNESGITVYDKERKINIFENESGDPALKVNDRVVSFADFQKVYLNAAVFRTDEIAEMANIAKVLENWDTLMELDFAKTISSKIVPNQRVDVFMIGESIHINKVNPVMNENTFFPSVTATQGRNLVLEFMNYDLGNTFSSILPKEEQTIKALSEKKQEYLFAIKGLEDKKTLLENHANPAIKNSLEVKELISAISEEIANLKAEYYEVQNELNSISKVEEGIGFAAGDEAELSKKK